MKHKFFYAENKNDQLLHNPQNTHNSSKWLTEVEEP